MKVSNLLGGFVAAGLIAAPLLVLAAETTSTPTVKPCDRGCDRWWTDDFDDFFNRPFHPYAQMQYTSAVRMKEDSKFYTITVDLPGVAKKDIVLETADNMITVSAERRSEEESKTKESAKSERSYSSFRQSFTLPGDADMNAIKATSANGVLKITVPKSGKKNSKKIEIN